MQNVTIVHLIMEVLDFNKVKTESEIKAQIEDLIKRRVITEKESKVLGINLSNEEIAEITKKYVE